MSDEPEDSDADYFGDPDDDGRCEVCDADTIDGGDPCPACCGQSFAPGSEECDFCEHEQECLEHANSL